MWTDHNPKVCFKHQCSLEPFDSSLSDFYCSYHQLHHICGVVFDPKTKNWEYKCPIDVFKHYDQEVVVCRMTGVTLDVRDYFPEQVECVVLGEGKTGEELTEGEFFDDCLDDHRLFDLLTRRPNRVSYDEIKCKLFDILKEHISEDNKLVRLC